MNRRPNQPSKPSRSGSSTRVSRECNCHDSFKRSREHSHSPPVSVAPARTCNTANTKPCLKKCDSSSNVITQKTQRRGRSPRPPSPRPPGPKAGKTWFQVLLDSPKKAKPEEVLNTARPRSKLSGLHCRRSDLHSINLESHKENFDPNKQKKKRLGLLIDLIHDKVHGTSDRQFLKILADINSMFDMANQKYNLESFKKVEPLDQFGRYLHFNDDITPAELKYDPVTDDDKRKLGKPAKAESKFSEKSNSEITLKALAKLLENMKTVKEKTEDQRGLLQNLTRLIGHLREENRMVNKLKDIRMDLESRLSSLSTENEYLRQKLESSERERDRTNRLLELKEKEIDGLKKHIASIKGAIAGKICNGFDDIDDQSFELKHLNDTIASLPSQDQSFELIRPASSSPTDELLNDKNQRLELKVKPKERRFEDEDSGIQSNTPEHLRARSTKCFSDQSAMPEGLVKLRDNVKKTVEDLQTDIKVHDVSFNLSDVTYKWTSS